MNFFSKLLAICTISLFYALQAQQTVRKDTIAGTELSMTMDGRVANLLEKMENSCVRPAARTHTERYTDDSTAETYTPSAPSAPRITIPARALTTAEICRQNPKILGYKIQLVVVKSNDEANKVKAYFRNRFPAIKVETDASLRPNYKILAGSYISRQSAMADLRHIKQYFNSALPVQYRVFCAEAK